MHQEQVRLSAGNTDQTPALLVDTGWLLTKGLRFHTPGAPPPGHHEGHSIDNRCGERGPLGLYVSNIPGIWSKLSRSWEFNTSLAEGSARRSQQTLTMRLGLPSLSGFLLFQRIQLTTR
ncbi:hypothetical protein ATANTOWER_027749 [Ataeniobius toweri]|uniref:Uncharacterized protein n=1 Tax=Ataeniobius toweri TaxID=208326 RepID=A0ABU7ARS2_9TELE|nr:hypothetical protein [Ataeniobius toweri]